MKRFLAATVVLLLAILVTSAYAARPKGDTRYVGKTGQGKTIKLRVTSDRKGLQMDFRQTLKCNNGRKIRGSARYSRQRPTIKSDGTFNYFKKYKNLPAAPPLKKGFNQVQRITGSFSKSTKTVRGRVADSVSDSSGLRCKVVTRFTAKRR